jgi:hypothetical protein
MVLLPAVDRELNTLMTFLDTTETMIDFMQSNLSITGSNANIIANSVFNTSNVTGMYNYLKNSSNQLRTVDLPSS